MLLLLLLLLMLLLLRSERFAAKNVPAHFYQWGF